MRPRSSESSAFFSAIGAAGASAGSHSATSSALLSLALVGNGFHRLLDGLGIAKVVVLDRLEVIVQLINQRLRGGDVEFDDFRIRDVVEVLDQRAQAVAVG